MTFKEELTRKTDEAYANIDVSRYIEDVKTRLMNYYLSREFTISLVKPKTTMALGSSIPNHISFFIPRHIEPDRYQQIFIQALKELGFTNNDINIGYNNFKDYEDYTIKLTW